MIALLRYTFFAILGLIGLVVTVGLVVLAAALTAPLWVTWGFPPAGTAKGEIARLAWAEQIPPQWQSPPTDISAKACPLVDDALKQEVAARAPESWGMFLGVCFFAQERLILIDSGGENGSCRASVEVSPPSCTP